MTAYLNSIRKYPILTKEREYELTKLYRETNDKKVRDEIINANLRYVVSIAKKVNKKYNTLPILDLISAGNEGLFRALKDYDPDKARFTTYAGKWIYQKMIHEIYNNSTNIRIPIPKREKIRVYFKKKEELERNLGRELTLSEIKEKLGYKEEQIREFESNIGKTISLSTKIIDDKDGSELMDLIADSDDVIPEEIIVKDDPGYTEMLLNNLSEREKLVIRLRTGIYDGKEYTLEQIGKIILPQKGYEKISKESVRNIVNNAKRKIRINKENAERSLELLGQNKNNTTLAEQIPTISDVIALIRTTNKEVITEVINSLCKSHRMKLEECFGNDILKAELRKGVSNNMIKHVLINVYPKLLYEVRMRISKIEKSQMVLPKNIFRIDEHYEKEDVEKRIDELKPIERLILNKLYDIYTGDLKDIENITPYEKEQIVDIIGIIKTGLIEYSTPKRTNKEINSKYKLFEYFGEDKEIILLIIETLPKEDIEFLQTWYGENYDIDPRTNGFLYKKMDKYKRDNIFNKIKRRHERFKRLQEKGMDISIEQFTSNKEINRCSKANIYEYFKYEGYSEEEITCAIAQLPDNDRNLLMDYYGSDLKHPLIDYHMPENLKKRVLVKEFNKIRKISIENRENKALKAQYEDE